jgi:hypothetical protein
MNFFANRKKTDLFYKLSSRVSLTKFFQSTPELFEKDYGGELFAFSFDPVNVDEWFQRFRNKLLDAIGKEYLPVYRMADGEFQFLLGEKFNYHNSRRFLRFINYLKRQIFQKLTGATIKTVWGETYKGNELHKLKIKYMLDLDSLVKEGILCPYLYENPKKAFTHYNLPFLEYMDKHAIELHEQNLFPFHFPFFALCNVGWQDFIQNKKILIVTGNLEKKKKILENNLIELGAKKVGFYEISANSSLKDKVNINQTANFKEFEIALIGAGIGSLNIISQFKWFNGPVIDVGGFLSALQNKDYLYHGGGVKFPQMY